MRTQNIPASLRRLRDSLPIFSPAIVLGEDDRHTLPSSDGSKLSRRSVVSNTQKSPLDLILDVATPPRIVPSEHLLIDHYEHITKIGEGSYADVYSGFRNGEEVVLKIVPVDGFYIDKTPQTSLEDILSEVLIARELTRVLLEGKTEWVAPVFSETYFVTVSQLILCVRYYRSVRERRTFLVTAKFPFKTRTCGTMTKFYFTTFSYLRSTCWYQMNLWLLVASSASKELTVRVESSLRSIKFSRL